LPGKARVLDTLQEQKSLDEEDFSMEDSKEQEE